jgi:hypothetical protein
MKYAGTNAKKKVNQYKAGGMSHIVDDFLFVEPANSSRQCFHDLHNFLHLWQRLGVPIKDSKTVLPTKVIIIHGIEVDSEEMECGLSQDKIVKINTVLISAMHGKKITLRSPQSLIGLLNFACMAVCPDRAFLRHLVDLTVKMVSPFHFIMLTCEARTELQVWQSFIETFNGKSVFLADTSITSDHLKLFTDASLGWFTKVWPSHLQYYQIAIKELFPIVLALTIEGGDSLEN